MIRSPVAEEKSCSDKSMQERSAAMLMNQCVLPVLMEIGNTYKDSLTFAHSLLRIAAHQQSMAEICVVAVATSITRAGSPRLLFRKDMFSTVLMAKLCKMSLVDKLRNLVQEEVDEKILEYVVSYPASRPEEEAVAGWIRTFVSRLFGIIMESGIDGLCQTVYRQTTAHFAPYIRNPYMGVAGLMFLCTICPCLAQPTSQMDVEVSDTRKHRLLILTSKLVQKLVNRYTIDPAQPALLAYNELFLCNEAVLSNLDMFLHTLCRDCSSGKRFLEDIEVDLEDQYSSNDVCVVIEIVRQWMAETGLELGYPPLDELLDTQSLGRGFSLDQPEPLSVYKWKAPMVSDWLCSIGLEEYASRFVEEAIDGSTLKMLTESDLLALGIHKIGHRLRFFRECDLLYQLPRAKSGPTRTMNSRVLVRGRRTTKSTPSLFKKKKDW